MTSDRTQLLVESFDSSGFRVNGKRIEGAILIRPEALYSWTPPRSSDLTAQTFQPLLTEDGDKSETTDRDVLLFGIGQFERPPTHLAESLRTVGVGLEIMKTGAACRAYHLLASENRCVAAALIPEDLVSLDS